MSPGSPDLIEIFRRARLAPTPVERDAILDQELGDDSATRELVLSLLRHDQADDSFLTRAIAIRRDVTADSATLAGATLGPYRVLTQIGAGGFADVYEAEQVSPVRRTVALKVLKPYLVTPEVVSRFRAEQQALAAMAHPCIASVYDASETPDGRPFFVMEFVAGEPITTWIQRAAPSRTVILDVLTRVCDAVQHAHDRGVIHRDIKSSNVLIAQVDGVPMPKVIDFGVAKAVGESLSDRSIVTGAAQIIGTLGSMSPEQLSPAKVAVDKRTDVYALGALCFEALTGRPLYELKGLELPSAIRLVSEGEPTSLQTQARMLGPDLRAILTKATETDKTRRYDSPRALREDLLRARDNRPIAARVPSWLNRSVRFAQRNKAVVAGIAATMLALTIGLIVSILQAARASSAEAVAAAQRDEYAQVTRDTVTALQQAIESLPGALPVNRVLAERALTSLELLAEHSRGDPKVLVDLSHAYRRLARLQGMPRGPNNGNLNAAIASLRRAVALAEPVLTDSKYADQASTAYLHALLDLGETLISSDSPELGVDVLLSALDACEERIDRDPLNRATHCIYSGVAWSTVRMLLYTERPIAAYRVVLRVAARLPHFEPSLETSAQPGGNTIVCTYYLGTLFGLVDRFDEAEQMFDRALQEFAAILGPDPDPSLWDVDIGDAHRHRALMRLRAENYTGAIEAIAEARACYERARTVQPDYRSLEHIIIYSDLIHARALRANGELEAAEARALGAAETAEKFCAIEPEADLWTRLHANALGLAACAIAERLILHPETPNTPAEIERALGLVNHALDDWNCVAPLGVLEDVAFSQSQAKGLHRALVAASTGLRPLQNANKRPQF